MGMDESVTRSTEGECDDAPYTAASVTRPLLSQRARLAAVKAIQVTAVGGGEDVGGRTDAAALLGAAQQSVALAEKTRKAAVLHAQTSGVSWSAIGEVLGEQRQIAHRRYAKDVQGWTARATDPEGRPRMPETRSGWTADGLAADLDAWLGNLGDETDNHAHPDGRTVSRALRRLSPTDELALLGSTVQRMMQAYTPLPLAELAEIRAREAVLHRRLARAATDPARLYRNADGAQAQADELGQLLAVQQRSDPAAVRIAPPARPGGAEKTSAAFDLAPAADVVLVDADSPPAIDPTTSPAAHNDTDPQTDPRWADAADSGEPA